LRQTMQMLPWSFSLATAIWFGMMARRAGRNWVPWALGGALFALVTTTVILGVSQAAFIPLSHGAVVRFRIKTVAAACLIVGFLGWLLTLSLQRWRLGARQERKPGNQLAGGKK